MARFVKYSLLLAVLSVTCWAQFKVTGIVRPKNYSPAKPGTTFNGIQYNGGPVMNNPQGVNVYYIWYGNWSNDTAGQAILTDFITHIGGSAYFNINSSYYDFNNGGEKDPVTNRVNFKGSITDNYSLGTALSDNDLGCIIQNAAISGKLPFDLNGQYFVLTSPDVIETSGFCTAYCAFHGSQTVVNSCSVQPSPNQLGQNLVGSFVGNPDQCRNACEIQFPASPNNDPAGDGMVSWTAHELSESVTDPYGTAWINPDGTESGDLCEIPGPTKRLPNGSIYNLKLGGRLYLSQEIWVNARGGYCAMSLDQ